MSSIGQEGHEKRKKKYVSDGGKSWFIVPELGTSLMY